jgi:hypothetical protein
MALLAQDAAALQYQDVEVGFGTLDEDEPADSFDAKLLSKSSPRAGVLQALRALAKSSTDLPLEAQVTDDVVSWVHLSEDDLEVRAAALKALSNLVRHPGIEHRMKKPLVQLFCDHLRHKCMKVRSAAHGGLDVLHGFSRVSAMDIPNPMVLREDYNWQRTCCILSAPTFRALRQKLEDAFHLHGVDFAPNTPSCGYDCTVTEYNVVVHFYVNIFSLETLPSASILPLHPQTYVEMLDVLDGLRSEPATFHAFKVELFRNDGEREAFGAFADRFATTLKVAFPGKAFPMRPPPLPAEELHAIIITPAAMKSAWTFLEERIQACAPRKSILQGLATIGQNALDPIQHEFFAPFGYAIGAVERVVAIAASVPDLQVRATAMETLANVAAIEGLDEYVKMQILHVILGGLRDDYLLVRSSSLKALRGVVKSTVTPDGKPRHIFDPVFDELKVFLETPEVKSLVVQEFFAKDRRCYKYAKLIFELR